VNHTRPRSSIIGLCVLVRLSQIGSRPQYGEGAIGASREDGVSGSSTGWVIVAASLATGSSTGISSVLSSVAP
jgi:hypothetical protein